MEGAGQVDCQHRLPQGGVGTVKALADGLAGVVDQHQHGAEFGLGLSKGLADRGLVGDVGADRLNLAQAGQAVDGGFQRTAVAAQQRDTGPARQQRAGTGQADAAGAPRHQGVAACQGECGRCLLYTSDAADE